MTEEKIDSQYHGNFIYIPEKISKDGQCLNGTIGVKYATHYTEEEFQEFRIKYTSLGYEMLENDQILGFVNKEKQWFLGFSKSSRIELSFPFENAIKLGFIKKDD